MYRCIMLYMVWHFLTAEVFKIKKSSHSRRIAKQLKRDSKKEKEELTANETKQATTSVQETSQNKKVS